MFGPCTPLAFVTTTPRASIWGVTISSSPAATELNHRSRRARASSSSVRPPVTITSASGSACPKAFPSAYVTATRPSNPASAVRK